jgi:hypothetical protein
MSKQRQSSLTTTNHIGMHEKALNRACIPYISLVLNAKKIKILIVICHDEHDEIKVIIIIITYNSCSMYQY